MKIKLLKPHRHAGKNYLAGEVLDLDLDTANYLAEAKVATPFSESVSEAKVTSMVQSEIARGRGKPSEVIKGVTSIPTVNNSVDPVGSNQSMVNQPTGTSPEIA